METDNKRISIGNRNIIKDIEDGFMLLYPYLKIEFFKIDENTRTMRSSKIEPDTLLNSLANISENQRINISSNRTVAEVTHEFEHALGTIVKVSRKSGNVWVAISVTEGWTLASQNTEGRNISNEMGTL
jgi:hypothetical protein